ESPERIAGGYPGPRAQRARVDPALLAHDVERGRTGIPGTARGGRAEHGGLEIRNEAVSALRGADQIGSDSQRPEHVPDPEDLVMKRSRVVLHAVAPPPGHLEELLVRETGTGPSRELGKDRQRDLATVH